MKYDLTCINKMNVNVLNETVCTGTISAQDIYVEGQIFFQGKCIDRTATTGAGAGVVISVAGNTGISTSQLLPSVGCIARTNHTGVSDALPSTASIITAVSAVMPGGVWTIGTRYTLLLVNMSTTTGNWTLTRGDSSTGFSSASVTFMSLTGVANVAVYRYVWITRVSSTNILIYECNL